MKTLFFLFALTTAQIANACCGRTSADIRYELVTANTFHFTVIVYTCLSSPFDLPEIEVSIDQSVGLTIPRTSVTDDPSADQRRSEYSFEQVFIGNGMHSVDATVGLRGAGMVNIPNSISESVCIRAEVLVDPAITSNSSIAFVTPPTQIDQVWNAFVHTPSPSDADGDSLAFELGIPRGWQCIPIVGYQPPVAVNFIWLDPGNGTFIWDYPNSLGEFNLTIIGSEYRNDQLIGKVTRDMTICIAPFAVGMGGDNAEAPLVAHLSLTDDHVTLLNRTNGALTLDVIAMHGALVGTYLVGPEQSSISIGHLAPGLYIFQARAQNGTVLQSTRLMRQ